MADGANKRKYNRLPGAFNARVRRVKVSQSDMEEIQQMVVKNISMGGVFIETSVPFAVNTVIRVSFKLPGSDHEIQALGIVRWVSDSRGARGMGIQFLQVTTEHKDDIKKHIKLLEKQKEKAGYKPAERKDNRGAYDTSDTFGKKPEDDKHWH